MGPGNVEPGESGCGDYDAYTGATKLHPEAPDFQANILESELEATGHAVAHIDNSSPQFITAVTLSSAAFPTMPIHELMPAVGMKMVGELIDANGIVTFRVKRWACNYCRDTGFSDKISKGNCHRCAIDKSLALKVARESPSVNDVEMIGVGTPTSLMMHVEFSAHGNEVASLSKLMSSRLYSLGYKCEAVEEGLPGIKPNTTRGVYRVSKLPGAKAVPGKIILASIPMKNVMAAENISHGHMETGIICAAVGSNAVHVDAQAHGHNLKGTCPRTDEGELVLARVENSDKSFTYILSRDVDGETVDVVCAKQAAWEVQGKSKAADTAMAPVNAIVWNHPEKEVMRITNDGKIIVNMDYHLYLGNLAMRKEFAQMFWKALEEDNPFKKKLLAALDEIKYLKSLLAAAQSGKPGDQAEIERQIEGRFRRIVL